MISDNTPPCGQTYFYVALALVFLPRVFLMPVTMHSDLLFIHYFPYFLSYKGVWDIYGYFGDHYLSQGFTYYPPLLYYIVGFFQWVFHWVNPGFDEFINQALQNGPDLVAREHSTSFTTSRIFQYVFFMKLPYLFADLGCLWAIGQIYSEKQTKAGMRWLWNPVLLFSVYIFGQYRIFSAFFTWLVLFAVSKNKKILACLGFGALCLLENYPVYLFLPSLLILGDDWRERFKLFFWMILPVAMLLIPLAIASKGYVFYAYFSPLIVKTAAQGIFRHYPQVTGVVGKTMLAGFYLFTLFDLLKKNRNGAKINFHSRFLLFIYVNSTLLLVLYAVSTTMIHYFMWILPLFVALHIEGQPWKAWCTWVLIVFLFLFNLDSRALNLGLLRPLGEDYFLSLPSLHEWMSRMGVPWGIVVGLSRLGFSALCLYFTASIYIWRIRPLHRANSR